MRMTKLFTRTLREDSAEAETVSHRLLLKAGMIYQVATGIYSYQPMALRSLNKIEKIIREEMDAVGGQEIRMPALQPREMWDKSGRAAAFGDSLFSLKDRRGRELVLAPTHEEIITSLVQTNIASYRDLPVIIYQIQTKFRDEPRPRGGLIRVREFDMKDAYSLDIGAEGLDATYQKMLQAYSNIYERCGLPTLAVEADSGAIGGKDSHEFILPAENGEDTIFTCTSCHYAANAERAKSVPPSVDSETELPIEKVLTPGVKTIADLAQFLAISAHKVLKAIFYIADTTLIFVTIRGDLEVNETKLKNLLHANNLRLAADPEIQAAGLLAGFASPVGLKGVQRIADTSITNGNNFVVGANEPDTHLRNANYLRDFHFDQIHDIALAQPGHGCPLCGASLESKRGIEIGHIFKLGTVFSEKFGAHFLDRDGHQRPVVMGCYGIGIGRLLAAAIEQNHDDKGIIFPTPIAPYQIHVIALNTVDAEVQRKSEELYQELVSIGYEVLFDDRHETAGVKFNDADLLGLPIRIVISPRNLKQDVAEMQCRRENQPELIPLDELKTRISLLIRNS
jgi:prolyl-tRNA synthetase